MLAVMNHCSCFKDLAKNARFKKGGISEICSDTLNILFNIMNHKHGHYLIVKTNLTAESEYWLSLCMHPAIGHCYSNLFFSYLYTIILLGYFKSFHYYFFFFAHTATHSWRSTNWCLVVNPRRIWTEWSHFLMKAFSFEWVPNCYIIFH